MNKPTQKHLSTTALARQMGKESKELFVLLANSGWIVKVDNRWQLTEKGKFEGGIYAHHPKFGDYIAWPQHIREHPLLQLLPEAPLTASAMGQKVGLPARLLNLLLAERGWLRKAVRGWQVTARGQALGGQQHESEHSGVPFVTWPERLTKQGHLLEAVAQMHGSSAPAKTLDGHEAANQAEAMIDNWLYVAGLVHARNYPLDLPESGAEPLAADFYLPQAALCIEYWGKESDAAALSQKLEKQEYYRQTGQDFVELQDSDLESLDDILARELLRRGVAVY